MNSSQKRVLIVDDEEDLTWTLSKKLTKDRDKFQLICVNSGNEAKEVLNQLPVDLVVTDIRMPEVSGLELLVQIKEKFPETKVIIMTAYGSADVQKLANDRGCFSYLEKPFEINEFREIILEALTEKKGFNGKVSDFQLSDIIQLYCLGRHTLALKVVNEDEVGHIYFDDGNIVHAATNTLEGENAFYYILSWLGGEFTLLQNEKTRQETINKGWQSLLLEALRRADEKSGAAHKDKEREKHARIQKIHLILNPLLREGNIHLILIHNFAGFPITFLPTDTPQASEVEEIGNQISNIYSHLNEPELLSGKLLPNFLEIHFNDQILISSRVNNSDNLISILSSQRTNIGFVRLELRKILKKIKELL
jgi:CheY-like chemotaxis protein